MILFDFLVEKENSKSASKGCYGFSCAQTEFIKHDFRDSLKVLTKQIGLAFGYHEQILCLENRLRDRQERNIIEESKHLTDILNFIKNDLKIFNFTIRDGHIFNITYTNDRIQFSFKATAEDEKLFLINEVKHQTSKLRLTVLMFDKAMEGEICYL